MIRRDELRRFLELFALCGFVVVQPVLDVMGRSPDAFVFWGASTTKIVLLATILAVVPPVVLWAAGLATALAGDAVRRWVHLGTVTVLLALLAVQVLKRVVSTRGLLLVVAAVALGAAAGWLYHRRDAVGLWMRYASPAPLVFAATFLLVSPVSDLVLPGDDAAASTAATTSDTPVVMLLLDEFPLMSLLDERGRIDERLYPNFAALAGESSWYRNATGISWFTPHAVPAMLSGKRPEEHLAPVEAQYPETLFTLLEDSHRVVASESITRLCPSTCRDPSGQRVAGFREILDEAAGLFVDIVSPRAGAPDPGHEDFAEDVAADELAPEGSGDADFAFSRLLENQPSRFTDLLDAVEPRREGRPPFYFLHLLMPHRPFRYMPSGRRSVPERGPPAPSEWEDGSWLNDYILQRHLLQVAYTDRLLGQLVERMKQAGIYDDALLVVTADHGLSFIPNTPIRNYTEEASHQIAWVPMFLKMPGQDEGRTTDEPWSHLDLLPTVADALDVEVPWDVDGASALAGPLRDEREFFRGPGSPLPVDEERWFPEVLEGFTAGFLRPESGTDGLFAPGPYRDLVLTDVDEHEVGDDAGVSVSLQAPGDFRDVTQAATPSIVSGAIEAGDGAELPEWLAVAVDGTIGGLGGTYEDDGARYAAMVADRLLTPGDHEITLYAVEGPPADPVLHPIEVVPKKG